jgi:hypothetical protein
MKKENFEMAKKQYTHSFTLKESYHRAVTDFLAQNLPLNFQVSAESAKRSEGLGYKELAKMLREKYSLTEVEAGKIRLMFRRVTMREREGKRRA